MKKNEDMMDGTEDDDDDMLTAALASRLRRLVKLMRPRAKLILRNGLFQWDLLRPYRLVSVISSTRNRFIPSYYMHSI